MSRKSFLCELKGDYSNFNPSHPSLLKLKLPLFSYSNSEWPVNIPCPKGKNSLPLLLFKEAVYEWAVAENITIRIAKSDKER
jgi:hypothetical protein